MTRLFCRRFVRTVFVVLSLMVGVAVAGESEMSRLERVWNDLDSRLDQTASFEFDELPLDEVLGVLSEEHDLPLAVDSASLDDMGLTTSDTVTLRIKNVPLRFSLRHALHPLDLDVIIRDEEVVVVSREYAAEQLWAVVYPVSDLLRPADGRTVGDRLETLTHLIFSAVQPNSWDEVGGSGTLSCLESCGALVISQTHRNHRRVTGVLDALRRLANQQSSVGESSVSPVRMLLDAGWRDALHAKLNAFTEVEFDEMPLDEAVHFLQEQHGLQFLFDLPGLDDLGITRSDPVSVQASGVSLRSLLNKTLRPLGLSFILRDGVVLITSQEIAEEALIPMAYPIGDLILTDAEWNPSSAPGAPPQFAGDALDFDSLIELVSCSIAPNSWDEVGGAGQLAVWEDPPCLVCVQTDERQAEIAHLLSRLRQARTEAPSPPERQTSGSAMVLESYQLQIDPKSAVAVLQLLRELVPEASTHGRVPNARVPNARVPNARVPNDGVPNDGVPNDGDAVIRLIGNQLIVKHRRAVQRKIQATLRSLQFVPPVGVGGGGGMGGGMFHVEPAG